MRLAKIFVVVMALLAFAAGCTQKKEPPQAKVSRVSATPAFEKYFGPAPTTDKGTCYAFVIYFPSAKEVGKAIPFPFFSFDEASLKKVAVQRLVGGMVDLKAYQGEILQSFPQGTHLLDLTENAGTVTANFSRELATASHDEGKQRALVNALAYTLRQFKGVTGVHILVDGKESPLNAIAQSPGESGVVQPSQPRLLSVTGMREQGAKNVEEVDAFFDRPVEIKSLQLSRPDGVPIQGDIYHSVFDMAAVMKPKDPTIFKAGMPIKIRFNVADKLGRAASGEIVTELEIREH